MSITTALIPSYGPAADGDPDDQARPGTAKPDGDPDDSTLPLSEYTGYLNEVFEQPVWRVNADKEMDYVDGNQLDSEVLQRMKAIGMPPAIEPLIGPAIQTVLGFEAKTRKDWRVTANSQGAEAESVADAINFELNQAERDSKADAACSEAFRPQLCVGLGWVEVAKESDPFKYKYRCKHVHRNEIWWDWLAKEQDLSDARYLFRRRWTDLRQAVLKFPDQKDIITRCGSTGSWTDRYEMTQDGQGSTNLNNAWNNERGWSIEEQEWRDPINQRVCLFECWYRRWQSVVVLKSPDGRVVEYDPNNQMHVYSVAKGLIRPERAVVSRVYVSFWMGPHLLYNGPTPYPHNHFPYVPFWGMREDRTGVPYGVVRGMIYSQDNVNSASSKIRWGLSAVRTERTKGAYSGTDAQFRQMISRVDADIVLNQDHMAKPGAKFEVFRDFQLTDQQYKMLMDSRAAIDRCSGIQPAYKGEASTARSGVQEQTQVEQSTQALADLMDNFENGRMMVGEQLMSLVIEDIGNKPKQVIVRGVPPTPDKVVQLNQPAQDPATGIQYRTNDVQRTQLKCALEEVPSTSSYRAQQLQAMSEAFKAMPQNLQVVCLPHLMALMDVPNKDAIIKAIVDSQQNQTEEQVQARIDAAVQQALKDSMHDLKARELDAKYSPTRMTAELMKMHAEINSINADAGKKFMELLFAGMQAAEVVVAVPQVAPVADTLIEMVGGVPGSKPGVQDIPQAEGTGAQVIKPVVSPKTGVGFTPGAPGAAVGPQPGDTTPLTPAAPVTPGIGANAGINTMRADSTGAQA